MSRRVSVVLGGEDRRFPESMTRGGRAQGARDSARPGAAGAGRVGRRPAAAGRGRRPVRRDPRDRAAGGPPVGAHA